MNITPTERQTIVDAGWPARLPGQPLFVEYRFGRRQLIRLAHQQDGACVFLSSEGKCRIHAETGVATKPLACRLYPYVPTPGVGSVRCDVRGDCPSVAANKGRSIRVHQAEILALAQELDTRVLSQAPAWQGIRLEASEFDALVNSIEDVLCVRSLNYRSRLSAGAHLIDLLHSIRLQRVRGEKFVELMRLLTASAIEQAASTESSSSLQPASSRSLRLFRQWLFLHAIADDPTELDCGRVERLRRSWRRYGESRRFAREQGVVPALRPEWAGITFEQVRQVAPAPEEALEPLIRSMRVKVQAHAFAGPSYYGYELLPGLTALWLFPSVVGWMSRAQAVVKGRTHLAPNDLLEGLRQAQHTFGVSPVFGRISERLRLRALSQPGLPGALLGSFGP